jgi:hypothetical protein
MPIRGAGLGMLDGCPSARDRDGDSANGGSFQINLAI